MQSFIDRNFRSRHHYDWFVGTTALLVIGGLFTFLGLAVVSFVLACFYALMLILAVIDTDWGRIEQREYFSRDCIWFNGFACELHALTLLLNALAQTPA